ncbi:MAG: hypothetical protein RLN87_02275 [Parasphingopyxis sp.]|uniref:hypothetical protein n=1 Tax=Parasphingopyxis sp. TaxID=1920299 RepID=UPI0032EF6DEC
MLETRLSEYEVTPLTDTPDTAEVVREMEMIFEAAIASDTGETFEILELSETRLRFRSRTNETEYDLRR